MEPQPLRSLPPPDFGEDDGGIHKKEEEECTVVMEGNKNIVNEESSSIKVDLENCEQNLLDKNGYSVLTPAQYFEFQRQALIFEHMKAGLPVPIHLWSPTWTKVASSDHGGIYKQYPSFVGVGFGPQNIDDRKRSRRTDENIRKVDHRYMMDPEPGRCRRTDGNKWRCKKHAVPDQKYCERHMHRGSQRSRKRVEASQIANPWGTMSPKDSENFKTISTHSQNNSRSESPLPLTFLIPSDSNSNTTPILSQLVNHSSNNTGNTTTATTNSKDENKNNSMFVGESDSNNVVGGSISATIDVASNATPNVTISIASLSTTITAPINTNTTTNDSNNNVIDSINSVTTTSPILTDTAVASFTTTNTPTTICTKISNINSENIGGKREGSNCTSLNKMIIRSSKNGNNATLGNSVSTGFGFSPKSVLQVLGCKRSAFYRSDVELELGRCRRTDGKKWRCSRVVVPDQKYCEKHMHRGAKKRLEASYPVAIFPSVAVSPCTPRAMSTSKKADSASTSTNLSISIPTSPQVFTNDLKSPTSCSSDATISDTTIIANENSNFSS